MLGSSDGWQVEFYVLDSSENASAMFNSNKNIFQNYSSTSSSEKTSITVNSATYSLTSSGYYMYLSKIDNTLLYVRVQDTYKNTVKDFVKALGY